ncbi:transglutaminase domain-containing protein [Rossellomorea aquimaris]|uniref:Transglutaminase domain-containing protein n=1 Tax=Rossellomorea aquimaris TaxID=189382 RepID=A0A5D4UPB2_9BACI|nr:transglutaminase-like domain-containing protein [Rossellomorea aquimaris]TYS82079.1 transglutaminase domain-containing protein [Rossellomorea aquimaris]TYS88701.1 transglutaminase domain-containing protein [Rossellomorea aquimaris]
MEKKYPFLILFLSLFASFLLLTACSDSNAKSEETMAGKKEEGLYEKEKKEMNDEIGEMEPLQLTSYSEEIGVTMNEPSYKEFAANGQVTVDGEIEQHSELKSDYAWIKVRAREEGPAGNQLEYYTPIKDGKFKQEIHFFNGEGEYSVSVQLPSKDRENYFYDTASFTVHNVNPDIMRDVTLTPFGQEAALSLSSESSYIKGNEIFPLKGEAANLTDEDTIMLRLKKDSKNWTHAIPVKNGEFSYEVPLFFGKGIHELEVLVPDEDRENYYQTATTLIIDNESGRVMSPIEYADKYRERGVTLESPHFGGEKSDGVYSIKGSIDPKAEFGPETTHIYITTKKGEDEALDVIPVDDFTFEDSFYLRFGPGTYEVTLSVPEIKEENSDYFRFFGFAKFEVESTGEDKRDLLPSRGVQSDAQEIKEQAKTVTAGQTSDRDKAKAIYDYVAKNVSYDVEKYENDDFNWDDSALKTLETRTGVCQDYAYLAIALLRASDIEARFVEGRAGGIFPGRHAWVEANLDGEWVALDPTWGSGYLKDGRFVPAFNEDYFDPDMNEFKKTHTRTGVSY